MTPLNIALICVFLQVALTFWAIVRIGHVRVVSLKSKAVSLGDIALDTRNYPDSVKQFQNNATNQFETPVLLYAVVAFAAATQSANWGVAIGAVIFVISRFRHRMIHVGSNHLIKRFRIYTIGLGGLLICWVSLGLGLLGLFG